MSQDRTLKIPKGITEDNKRELQLKAGSMNMMFSIAGKLLEESTKFFKEYKVLKHEYSKMAGILVEKVNDPANPLNVRDPEYTAIIKTLTNQVRSFCFFIFNCETPEQVAVYGNLLESIVLGEYKMSPENERDLALEKAQLIYSLIHQYKQNPSGMEWIWPILAEHNISKDYIAHPLDVIYAFVVKDKVKKNVYVENLSFEANK